MINNKFNQALKATAPSMLSALKAIADMEVRETTNFRELAALCISIAQAEVLHVKARTENTIRQSGAAV